MHFVYVHLFLPKSWQILCGCGGLDGTEIAEAVSVAIHCSQRDLLPRFFAPEMELCGLVNHLTREPDNSGVARNALVEGARLARPTIKSLSDCKACEAEALIIPGGYGAARTLSVELIRAPSSAISNESDVNAILLNRLQGATSRRRGPIVWYCQSFKESWKNSIATRNQSARSASRRPWSPKFSRGQKLLSAKKVSYLSYALNFGQVRS